MTTLSLLTLTDALQAMAGAVLGVTTGAGLGRRWRHSSERPGRHCRASREQRIDAP